MTASKHIEIVKLDSDLANTFAENIAAIFNNSIHHYWFSETDARAAIATCYENIRVELARVKYIAFNATNGELIINGEKVQQSSHNIEILIDHLEENNIDNFTLNTDLDEESFVNMLELLEACAEELEQLGGFNACIKRFNIKGVEHKKLVYRGVTEDEVIIAKDEISERTGNKDGEDTVGSILAFLKGELTTNDPDTIKQVQETATDASQMADLILKAAEIRQQETPIEEGESMVDFVVGCLRRTYATLTKQKSAKTKTGKKRITKNLLLLEQEVLDRMRSMSMEWTDDDLQAIVDATQEITDELKIDSLADEYMATKKMNQQIQQHIIDYVESVGIENVDMLKEKLSERGMDIGDWKELVVKNDSDAAYEGIGLLKTGAGANGSGSGEGPGGGSGFSIGSLVKAIDHLDVLFGSMEDSFDDIDENSRSSNSKKLVGALAEATDQIKTVTKETAENIEILSEGIQDDAHMIELAEQKAIQSGVNMKLTRRSIISSLAEIIKDISEPLAGLETALSIINSKTMGSLNEAQSKTLKLAYDNAAIISDILKKLEKITETQ